MDNTPQATGITYQHLWSQFLHAARGRLSSHVFETWLRPIACAAYRDGAITLEVGDQFARDWLMDHYAPFIGDTLTEIAGTPVTVTWNVNPNLAGPIEAPEEVSVSESIENTQERPSISRPLNPRYVFETFVAGLSNQLAFAASKAVADNPANAYNPLFLFGGTGLGKTHLLCAIGHEIVKRRPDTQIIYTSSEQFMNEVINAVRFGKLDEFHGKYRRRCGVLLMDDIQLIAGKDRTQHEFFHIFNTLYDSMRQIVVTSDKLPHEIPEIEERLRTRFQWGLIADIQPPEIETRIAILRKKADNEGFDLANDVAFFLAKNIRSNVRELEGALVRVMAHASLTGNSLTLDYTRQVLGDILVSKAQAVSVESIQKLVASYYAVKVSDLKSASRLKTLVRPRQVAMYLCRKHGNASYPELGSRFGNKDHTTVMSACKKVEDLIKNDPNLRGELSELERQLET